MFIWFFIVGVVAFVAGSFTSAWFKNEEIKALHEIIAIRSRVVSGGVSLAKPATPPTTPKA